MFMLDALYQIIQGQEGVAAILLVALVLATRRRFCRDSKDSTR